MFVLKSLFFRCYVGDFWQLISQIAVKSYCEWSILARGPDSLLLNREERFVLIKYILFFVSVKGILKDFDALNNPFCCLGYSPVLMLLHNGK